MRGPLNHWHEQGHEIWMLGLGYNGWLQEVRRSAYPYAERIMPIMGQESPDTKFGQASIELALRKVKPDVVMTTFDIGRVRYLCDPYSDPVVAANKPTLEALDPRRREFTHLAYFPIDGLVDGVALPRYFDEIIAGMDLPVTYSQYAQDAIRCGMGLDIDMIPIGHDPKVFYKRPRSEARSAINFPDGPFIMSMVATNQSRKLWPEYIKAAARVCRRHPDAFILPWTTWNIQINGGFDIGDLIYREGITTQSINVGNAVHAFTDEQMADFYSAIDVCVLTTVGEGAGLPPIRARACGTPGLVSANSSCIEFTPTEFELIPSHPSHVDNGNNLLRFSTDVDVLEERLEKLYSDRKFRDEIGEAGMEFSKQLEHSVLNPKWDKVLEKVS